MTILTPAEQRRRKALLKLLLEDLDEVSGQTEEERQQAAKDEAREENRELLPPLAAGELFGKSAATIRRAVAEGHVTAPVTLDFTAKPTRLLSLREALAYWGAADDELVGKMRDNGHLLGVGGKTFNVLSGVPLLTLSEPDKLE